MGTFLKLVKFLLYWWDGVDCDTDSWAGPARKPAHGLPAATGSGGRASLPCAVGSAWGGAERKFEFQQPTQVKRKVPEVVIMEKEREFEISQGLSGVSRLHLIPSFLPVSEADWMFAQLLADLPWKQKSTLQHGESYDEPWLTCWFGELPYTYSHSTLQPNTQVPATRSHCTLQHTGTSHTLPLHPATHRHQPTRSHCTLQHTGTNHTLPLHPATHRHQPHTPTAPCNTQAPATRSHCTLQHTGTNPHAPTAPCNTQHQVPKEYHDRGPRINLTFRMIYPETRPR
ncbi:hypothetical protein AOXY_G21351 [Acipenser oxyrinchus oxyrinchus]|uniref:Uncharacterized protein n=1 Tax=Acipenser oxyrinchus oxyrinchus TaxID=40147 RepID=A0AAD8D025_ACIOX|nr:hypothetical protein AOXY_G21351 [Acipenser oxyrinchus oxyrinchus]